MRLSNRNTQRKPAIQTPSRHFGKLSGALAVVVLLAAGLSSCGSIKPVKYYQLTHPPTSTLGASRSPIDAAILVRLFQTSHLYREDRIVYGGEGEQLGLYESHRWVEPPAELLQDALARGLRSSGHFRAVTTHGLPEEYAAMPRRPFLPPSTIRGCSTANASSTSRIGRRSTSDRITS